jgi:hypothetical protein
MPAIAIPLTSCADEAIAGLARQTGSAALLALDGAVLLGERAMLAGMTVPGRISASGACRLLDAIGGTIALNLARAEDRALLPALFESDALDPDSDEAIADHAAHVDAASVVRRGREMGLAIALEQDAQPRAHRPWVMLAPGCAARSARQAVPRVLDLSALWAGPLAAHLLWLAGAEVVKVESRRRPDGMRGGDPAFHALLNQGKSSVVLDFEDPDDLSALRWLIAGSDIVIEAARPRALEHLGIDAARIVRETPGLVWISITGHGASGDAAGWVGFGDDCGVAGGLSAALRSVSGRSGFIGDAIADPLTGIFAAGAAWNAWTSRRGGRLGLALSQVVAHALGQARTRDSAALNASLFAWSAATGTPFAAVRRRPIGSVAALGADTRSCLARVGRC